MKKTPRLFVPKYTYTMDYPFAIEASDQQMRIYWTAEEIDVEKDIQDMRVTMTPAAAHGVTTGLKLFTLYELVAGRDYWLNRIMKRFPRPDIQRMASTFGFFELNVHAPFYNKINEALMLNTDAFYASYADDPTLNARMEFVEGLVTSKDDLLSLGSFSMVEGAVLYSNFAYLKSFQAEGSNSILNVVRGINFSVRDENLHCEGGALLYKTLRGEMEDTGHLTPGQRRELEQKLIECAKTILEHEKRIVAMLFEKGEVPNISAFQLVEFVKSRLNLCLANLDIKFQFEIFDTTVASWFYKNINATQLHDFFTGIGSSYSRDWDESKFIWKVNK